MIRNFYTITFAVNLLVILMALSLGCAASRVITSEGIRNEMAAISREIDSNRSAMNALRERRVGKTGFYYVLDSDGRVVFHPRLVLIGSSFSKVWFVNQLLEEKSGCFTYVLGNRKHYLFYTPINDFEILCLSIISDDIPPGVDCKAAQVKSND
ncbi:MAG: Cache 3/Cache 2 fusion domain-containing protein [Spirochaetes bacterium]|nr:Cache 3/Cache 2 fusion domain-containing protein [Spirochaetota bacterium]